MLQLHELTNAQHSITAHQGGTWTIDAITNTVTVSATNLDIRDLAFASDSVNVSGSSVSISGSVTVTATALDIRALTNADVVTIEDGGGSITVDGTVAATQSGTWTIDAITNPVNVIQAAFASWKTSAVSVTNSATQIASTPLTGRKKIIIQNVGSQDIYVKDANTVSASVDGKIAKGASFEMELAAAATIYGITSSGSADVRVWEFAA